MGSLIKIDPLFSVLCKIGGQSGLYLKSCVAKTAGVNRLLFGAKILETFLVSRVLCLVWGYHSGTAEHYCERCEVITAVLLNITVRDVRLSQRYC